MAIRPDCDRGDRWLLAAGWVFTVAVVVHNSDHLRRGADAVSADVFWIGTAGVLVEVGIVALIALRHRTAPLAALIAGVSLATGYLVVHFLPARSWLSDAFPGAEGVSPLSWFAATFEVIAALLVAGVGWQVLRIRGGLSSAAQTHAPEGRPSEAFGHPMVLTMVLVNAVIVAVSFAQI